MRVSMSCVRRTLYTKFARMYEDVFNDILHTDFNTEGVSTYTYISDPSIYYTGIDLVLRYLDISDISEKSKRAFKNFWESTWSEIGGVLGHEKYLSTVGLCDDLVFYTGVTDFFTGLLGIRLLFKSENNGLSDTDVLYLLSLEDRDLFRSTLEGWCHKCL